MTFHLFSSSLIPFDHVVMVFRVQAFPCLYYYYYLLLSIIICDYIALQLIVVCPFDFISRNFAEFVHSNFLGGVCTRAHACACMHVYKSFGFSTCKIVLFANRVRILLKYLD